MSWFKRELHGPPRLQRHRLSGQTGLATFGTKFRNRICRRAFCMAALCVAHSSLTAQVDLSRIQPSNVIALDGASHVTPYVSKVVFNDKPSLQFATESTVSYPIPAGQNVFSGVLFFKNPPVIVSPHNDTGDRLRIRIYADTTLKLDAVFDQASPPLQINFSVQGAGHLTIKALDYFPPAPFYLAGASFSQDRSSDNASISLPAKGSGVVRFNDPAQALLQKFVPGSVAKFTASYAGNAGSASVNIDVRPEQSDGTTSSVAIPLRLTLTSAGVAQADGEWPVPRIFGPCLLTITLNAGGQRVWSRTILAALSPQLDLATVQDSSFGVHISESGYLRAADDFAYLWNAKWARVFIQWANVERTPGQFDFSAMDELLKSYQGQHIKVMLVLGESWPQWTGGTGPHFQQAWQEFVRKAVDRYKAEVAAWEPFNEIDSKARRQHDPNWDIDVLKSSITTIKQLDPNKLIVCCSSSTGTELDYQERLMRNGVLRMVNVLAIHPYQRFAPENREGVTDFIERIAALQSSEQKAGLNKPVWCTEAQWIMGPADNAIVTAPNIDDHTQAQYVIRANLMAIPNSKYFLHMGFFYGTHRMEHVDTLAAYSYMASVLSDPQNPRFVRSGPDVYAVTAGTARGVTVAFWTPADAGVISLSGVKGVQVFDMYGNRYAETSSKMTVGQEPTYVVATSGTPLLNINQAPTPPRFQSLAPVSTWVIHRPGEQVQINSSGVQVQAPMEQYGTSLKSQPVNVSPNSCYVVRIPVKLYRGSLMLSAVDASSGTQRGVSYISFRAGDSEPDAELRFLTGTSTQVNIIVGSANVPDPASSQFQITGAIEMAPCRRQH